MLCVNHIPIKLGKFPNQEIYFDWEGLKELSPTEPVEILCQFESNDDLMGLIFLKGTLDDLGFEKVSLFLPYLPYGGLDRTEGVRCLGIRYFARLLNGLRFSRVITWEAHSDVSLALLDRVENHLVSMEIALELQKELGRESLFVLPDLGAEKRYHGLRRTGVPVVVMGKRRSFEDGRLTEAYPVSGTIPKEAKKAVLVDDLCRGGRTACYAAKALKQAAPQLEEVYLCCAHVERSVFEGPILEDENITAILTTNSCLPRERSHPKIKCVRSV